LIEKDDLEDDIGSFDLLEPVSEAPGSLTASSRIDVVVVRIQHKYFVPIAVFSGLVMPTLIAKYGWGDAVGGYVWGGLVARLLIW